MAFWALFGAAGFEVARLVIAGAASRLTFAWTRACFVLTDGAMRLAELGWKNGLSSPSCTGDVLVFVLTTGTIKPV